MRIGGNTIFITGGTSGIGRGLAEAFHRRGSQVVVAGRRRERLEEVCEANPGMRHFCLDVTDAEAIGEVARQVVAEFPGLNCVINNAGVQRSRDFAPGNGLDEGALAEEIDTNLLGPIRVASAFLPQLCGKPGATLVNVSSGLAFVPMARFAVYCATKAALHSWTLSLRHQLRGTGVQVIEIIPPWVDTELGGAVKPQTWAGDRRPMPLDTFISEAMRELEAGGDELAIGDAKNLAAAAGAGTARHVFANMNR
jgi:uncharacterized oxidoreductase